jgi:hypothetical protein
MKRCNRCSCTQQNFMANGTIESHQNKYKYVNVIYFHVLTVDKYLAEKHAETDGENAAWENKA